MMSKSVGGEKLQKRNVPCEVLVLCRAMLRIVLQEGNHLCYVPTAQPISQSLPCQPWGQPGPGSSSGIIHSYFYSSDGQKGHRSAAIKASPNAKQSP